MMDNSTLNSPKDFDISTKTKFNPRPYLPVAKSTSINRNSNKTGGAGVLVIQKYIENPLLINSR
jgi:hypothetical protein